MTRTGETAEQRIDRNRDIEDFGSRSPSSFSELIRTMPQMRQTTYVPEAISLPTDGSLPAFLEACKSAEVAAVAAFVRAQDRSKDYLSRGLSTAAAADRVEIVRHLLEQGAVINPYLDPLAALRGKSLGTFKVVVEYGWDVKEEDYKILP